jgi:pimeloyl-ACP methyl ester carboxylesterase
MLSPPSRLGALREIRTIREPFRLLASRPHQGLPASGSRVVVTVPGSGSGDLSMTLLRMYLRRIGHRPSGWGLGRNDSRNFEVLEERLAARVIDLQSQHNDTVDLIGWSLGGMLVRAVARVIPGSVGRVVTCGTPVVGGPRYTVAAKSFQESDIREIERRIAERRSAPMAVPVTAIYSRNDGVVAWRACIDPDDTNVEHIEVSSSHLGMCLDPDVWRIVSDRLDRPLQLAPRD